MRTLKFGNIGFTSLGAAAFAALLAAVACSDSSGSGQAPDHGASAEHSGSLGLSLQLASGDFVASAAYTIIGPNGFSKTGAIDVSSSDVLSATIAPLPTGNGFSITLSASSSNGQAQCSGGASFNVLAHQTTSVTVPLVCHQAAHTGSVAINGTLNVCPVLDALNAAPSEVLVGNSIALNAVAHDSDAGPAALAYAWTASSGTLSDAHAAAPQFTCTSVGPANIAVSISDGDLAATCADVGSVSVNCTSAAGTGGTGGTSTGGGGAAGTGGGGAAGGSTGGGGAAGGSTGGGGAAGGGTGGGGAPGAGAGGGGAAAGGRGGHVERGRGRQRGQRVEQRRRLSRG